MNREEAKRRAEALVAKMTVEEKASQLKFNAEAVERLGIPEYNWWNEGLHGVARAGTATSFPQAIGLAATFDPELMKAVGEVISTEGRAKYNEASSRDDRDIYKGLTYWSPNVNIFRDPRWGRGHETYGEDPYLTSRMAVPFIHGLQGDSEHMKLAACAKHFAGHSGPEALRHFFNAEISKKDLEETYLPAFEACVKEGQVEAVMGAYNRTNGEPCCANHELMTEILRKRWGFEGHYVSDCWAVRDFHESHKVTSRPEESVTKALSAGCDLNCGCTYERILNAYEEGLLDEKYITESCVRVMTARFLLGMFEETEFDHLSFLDVETKEHLAVAKRASEECVVLLKNNGLLPLSQDKLHTIGVIGPNANSRLALIGNYHGTSSRYITILEGIQDLVGDSVRVLYSAGCDLWRPNAESLSKPEGGDRLSEAAAVAAHSDVVILVTGLDETLEGEEGDTGNSDASGDKADLRLPESQRRLMDTVFASGKPVILVNMTGSSVDLCLAQEKAEAVLQAWYPGARGGAEVADILFGRTAPSGKLPVTFYRGTDDLPDFTDYAMAGRTYRYYGGMPLYPFGYGLTYGDAKVTEACAEQIREDGTETFGGVRVKAKVKNNGICACDEVVQVYIRDEEYSLAVPNPALAAFARVHLESGEEKTVELDVLPRAFTSVDADGIREIRSRRFTLYAGCSQPDERSAELTGHRPVQISVEL